MSRETAPIPIHLLLVDDHEIVRLGLRALFERTSSVRVVGEAQTVTEAIGAAGRLRPDVVLLDVRFPDGSGVTAAREIRARLPDTKIVFLTSYADEHAMLAMMFGGASGYMLKEVQGEALIRAVVTAANGLTVVDPSIGDVVRARMRGLSSGWIKEQGDLLSRQERRVLALVAEGKTNKEIAAALTLSDKTVKNYVSHIFQKLQVSRRSQAAVLFTCRGLVPNLLSTSQSSRLGTQDATRPRREPL